MNANEPYTAKFHMQYAHTALICVPKHSTLYCQLILPVDTSNEPKNERLSANNSTIAVNTAHGQGFDWIIIDVVQRFINGIELI